MSSLPSQNLTRAKNVKSGAAEAENAMEALSVPKPDRPVAKKLARQKQKDETKASRTKTGARKRKSLQPKLALLHSDPQATADMVDLVYVHDDVPGITRKKRGKNFVYFDARGQQIKDPETLERIRLLGLPPAYENVWICPLANGHLQATGKAANGKKQYFYHPQWRAVRDLTKFSQMISFGELLPKLRETVEADLKRPGLPRQKVLAAVVRLLECTSIRIGNERYAKENDSYGLTTLTNDHVDIHGNKIRFEFRGKGGKDWSLSIVDAKLANIIRKCECLPGYDLFQYVDTDGNPQSIGSRDVNEYLQEISGQPITAKCFRTWAGTVAAFRYLKDCEAAAACNKTASKRNITEAIKSVAEQLGNTAAVCKKNYIHPQVFDCYLDGTLHGSRTCPPVDGLDEAEAATLALLKESFAQLENDLPRPA